MLVQSDFGGSSLDYSLTLLAKREWVLKEVHEHWLFTEPRTPNLEHS